MHKVKSLVQIIACVCSKPNNSNNKDYRGRSTGPISRVSLSFSMLMMLFAPAISAGSMPDTCPNIRLQVVPHNHSNLRTAFSHVERKCS